MYNILFLMIILGNPVSVDEVSLKRTTIKGNNIVTTTPFNLESSIKILYPAVKPENLKMVITVIKTKAFKYGLTKKDYPLILAMIMTESTFRHILYGAYGEIGMLQVIPTEGHIKKCVASHIKCKSTEKYCKKNGRPDIYGKRGNIYSYKVKRFLASHPHYALETGFCEMSWWKARWHKVVKRRLWKYFPKRHLVKRLGSVKFESEEVKLRNWWHIAKNRCGDMLWVSSYNWGSVIPRGSIHRWYPVKILKYYNLALGRKSKTVYSTPYAIKASSILKVTQKK